MATNAFIPLSTPKPILTLPKEYHMARYRIQFDRNTCIGTGACSAVAPESWKLGKDGKSIPLITEFEDKDLPKNLDACRSCPVNAIKILDEKGKSIN